MQMLTDIAVVYGRIITLFPLLVMVAMYMGKRSMGELPVFDFLIMLSIGSLFGADIADPNIHHLPTAAAILFIGFFQRAVSTVAIHNRWFGKLVSFHPTIVVHQGQLIKNNIRRIRYTIDNILQMLREKDVFDVTEVECAIVEANGRMTVMKKPEHQTITRDDLQLENKAPTFSLPVVIEGRPITDTLRFLQLDLTWLEQQLGEMKLDREKLFLVTINENRQLHVAEAPPMSTPYPFHH